MPSDCSHSPRMLYDFHKTQNDRRPGAVHATYLVHGAKKAVGHSNGGDGDVDMTNASLPDNESMGEGIPLFTLSLVPEDQLKGVHSRNPESLGNRPRYLWHVLRHRNANKAKTPLPSMRRSPQSTSTALGPIQSRSVPCPNHETFMLNASQDMALLADVAEQALRLGPAEGPSPSCIVNSEVRRRERKGAPRPAPKAAPQPTSKTVPQPTAKAAPAGKTAKQEAKPSIFKSAPASSKAKEEPKSSQVSKDADTPASSAPAKKPPATLKRGGSSNSGIMQAFSKATSMPKKEKPVAASNPATPSGDDSSMHVMSDDGEDDEDVPQPKARAAGRKTKKQREEELRLMMEEDEDDEDEPEKAPTPEEEPMEEEAPAPEPVKEEPAEVVTASEGGRRRGKRRVMRKKQIMDDQGYLGEYPGLVDSAWCKLTRSQSPSRSRVGSPSRRTRPLLPPRPKQQARLRQRPLRSRRPRRLDRREAREILCLFSQRSS